MFSLDSVKQITLVLGHVTFIIMIQICEYMTNSDSQSVQSLSSPVITHPAYKKIN